MADNVTITYQGYMDCQQVISLVQEMQSALDQLNSLVQNIPPSEWAGDAVLGLKDAVADMKRITTNDFEIISSKAHSGITFYHTLTDHDSTTGQQMRG